MFSSQTAFSRTTRTLMKIEKRNKKITNNYEKSLMRSINRACKKGLFFQRVKIPTQHYAQIIHLLETNHFTYKDIPSSCFDNYKTIDIKWV